MSIESSKRIEGYLYELQSNGFTIKSDVSEKQGGTNGAPDPHDYLQVALAGCTAITLQMYANRKQIPLESVDVKIRITAEGEKNEILREISLVGNLTEEQKVSLLKIADKCPIHKFLAAGCGIVTQSF